MSITKLQSLGWLLCISFYVGTAAAVNWDGSDSVNWSNANNWDTAPGPGDPLVFSLAGQAFQPLNNNIVGGSYSGITFNTNIFTNDVTGPNTHIAISGNSLQIGAAGFTATSIGTNRTVELQTPVELLATATVANATANTTFWLSGAISGSNFGLTKTGGGILKLTGNNTFTGKTTIAGFLDVETMSNLGVSGPLGAPTLATTTGEIALGGTYRFVGSTNQSTDRNLRTTASNGTVDASGTGGASATYTGTLATADRTTRLGGTGLGIYNGTISSGTNSGFSKIGTGTWILGGATNNSFGHNITVSAGTLIAAKNNAFGTTNVSGGPYNVLVTSGATVGIQGGINYTQVNKGIRLTGTGDALNGRSGALDNVSGNNSLSAPIVLTGAATIGASSGSLDLNGTLDNAGFLLTVGGPGDILKSTSGITGTGGLTKTGPGKLTLAATNAYSGNTTVQQGELELTGSLDNSDVILTGGVLSGTGSMKSLAVGANSVVSPGLSPGELTVLQNVTFADDGEYEWEINDWDGTAGTNFDLLDIMGTLAFTASAGNPFIISLESLHFSNTPGDVPDFAEEFRQWVIASAAGGITGLATDNYQLDTSGFMNVFEGTFSLSVIGGTQLVLTYTPVLNIIPEPSTLGLIGLASLMLLRFRRGRRGI